MVSKFFSKTVKKYIDRNELENMGKKIAMVMLSTAELAEGENEDVAARMKQALQDGLLTVDETSTLNIWNIDKVSVIDL